MTYRGISETIVIPSESEISYSPNRWWCGKIVDSSSTRYFCPDKGLAETCTSGSDECDECTFLEWADTATDPDNRCAPLAPPTHDSNSSWNQSDVTQHLPSETRRVVLDHCYATQFGFAQESSRSDILRGASNQRGQNPFSAFMCRHGWEWQSVFQTDWNSGFYENVFLPRNDSIPLTWSTAPVRSSPVHQPDRNQSSKKNSGKAAKCTTRQRRAAKPYATRNSVNDVGTKSFSASNASSQKVSPEKLIVKFDFKVPKGVPKRRTARK